MNVKDYAWKMNYQIINVAVLAKVFTDSKDRNGESEPRDGQAENHNEDHI